MTTPVAPSNHRWLRKWLRGEPHLVVGGEDGQVPYLLRWYVIPRNRRLNIYVHKFLRDDDDRALHDHPWWFLSVVLRGGYVEHTESADYKLMMQPRTSIFDVRSPFWRRSVGFRPATWRHRVVLPWAGQRDEDGRVPCWTLIVTGRKTRLWGFWCPTYSGPRPFGRRTGERFIPWDQFGSGGCGEVA
jgi:hypothetical protein